MIAGMNTVAIPPWSGQGVIPPINESHPTSAERSPYEVLLSEFIHRFGQATYIYLGPVHLLAKRHSRT